MLPETADKELTARLIKHVAESIKKFDDAEWSEVIDRAEIMNSDGEVTTPGVPGRYYIPEDDDLVAKADDYEKVRIRVRDGKVEIVSVEPWGTDSPVEGGLRDGNYTLIHVQDNDWHLLAD